MHQSSSGKQPVRVVVRTRPSEQPADAVTLEGKTITIRQTTPQISGTAKTELLSFSCDAVLANASQEKVFSDVAKPICDDVLEGFNGTIMCYGQTGAGKSFTMVGDGQDYQLRGVAPRAIGLVFREMAERPEWIYTIRISCLEIYNENLYDLLATLPEFGPRAELSLKAEGRGGIPVKGLTAAEVRSEEEALRYLFEAEANRAVAQHALNQASSRSHVLYMLQVERRSRVAPGAVQSSRLTLVDLAGSERLKKSAGGPPEASLSPQAKQQRQQQQQEAMNINRSLAFLEQVVMAMASRQRAHVPHRSSRLTAVLREALGGNCRTTLVANICTEARHLEETISTLKFALRMQSVTTSAVLNSHVEMSPEAALQQCHSHVAELKRELAMHDQLAHRSSVRYDPFTEEQQLEVQEAVRCYLDGEIDDLEVTSLRHAREIFAQFKNLYALQAQKTEEARARVAGMPPAAGAEAASEVEIPAVEVVEFVGDDSHGPNAHGFGAGEAPDHARPAVPVTQLLQPRPHRSQGGGGQTADRDGEAAAQAEGGRAADVRAQGFEEFKRGAGREMSALLAEHKTALREKKAQGRRLGAEVNAAKHQIDELKELLERKAEARGHGEGRVSLQEGGEQVEVIDEEEFGWLSQLKAAKAKYRQAFESLREVRSDAEYVSTLVENTRAQLLTDFDTWLVEEKGMAAGVAADLHPPEAAPAPTQLEAVRDQDEEFEALMTEKILQTDPDSLAFVKAAKTARPNAKTGQHAHGGPRSKPRAFQ